MARSGLPRVASPLPADLLAFLDRVRDFMESAPTTYSKIDDLVSAGIITRGNRGRLLAGDIDAASELPPPAPTGLAGAGAMTNILWTWDDVIYPNPGYTEIWASGTDDLGTAVVVGTAAKRATLFPHPVGAGQTRYAWIRFISEAGLPGPFNAVAGTVASTSNDPAWLLSTLADQISEDQLTADLNTRIDLVDADASVSGSVNARIAYVQGQVSDLLMTPTYDSGTSYVVDDLVTYSGGLYICISATTGNAPTNATYWTRIGDYSALADAVAANTSNIATVVSDLSAETTARATLATQLRGSETGTDIAAVTAGLLYSEKTARSTADGALSDSIDLLSATVDDNTAAILTEATARATADTAVAETVHALQVSTSVSDEDVAYAALRNALGLNTRRVATNASIAEEQIVRADADAANASAITTLSAQVNDATTGLPATRSLLISDYSTTSSMNSAIASASTALQTQIDDNVAAIEENLSSIDGVRAIYTVKMDVDGVVSGYGLMSEVVDDGTVFSKAIFSVDEFAIIAPGRTVGTLASVPFAALTSAQTINGVAFAPGVYIDGASINAGTIGNAQIGTAAIDTANIVNAAISSAKIADAAIVEAKIGNAAINTVHIQTGAITTAVIADAAITAAKIADATITYAKIEDSIQSSNYSAGTAGFRINKTGAIEANELTARGTVQSSNYSAGSAGWKIASNGDAEFNSGTFRGTLAVASASSGARTTIANDVIKVYDSSGTVRVQIGNLA